MNVKKKKRKKIRAEKLLYKNKIKTALLYNNCHCSEVVKYV